MRILFVEDNKELSDATGVQLRAQGWQVDACYDGGEALYYIEENIYDVVILDRMLPGMEGVEILKKMRRGGNETPVLMLTALGMVGDKVDGLEAGADDYLVKPFDMRELLARVKALARRPGGISPQDELYFGDLTLDTMALMLQGAKARCTLSKKEADFLALLMKNDGAALSRRAIFAHVWGMDADVEEASLDSYAHFVRRRLAAVSQSVSLVTVRGVGYRLENAGED